MNDLAIVHEALARHGIDAAGSAHPMAVLAAAIYSHGWSYVIDRMGGDYQATVHQAGRGLPPVHAVMLGWSQDSALAFALDRALTIQYQGGRPITGWPAPNG